jgi:hypothetical protein
MPTPLHPNQPTNIGLANALTRLGSGNASLLDFHAISPVMVVADLSKTLSGELIEARAIAAHSYAGGANYRGIHLLSKSAGGLVVEFLRWVVSIVGAGSTTPSVTLIRPITPLAGVNPIDRVDAGGVATVSEIAGFSQAGNPEIGADQDAILQSPFAYNYPGIGGPNDRFWGELPSRLYVPPGESVYLYTFPTQYAEFLMTWRELEDPQGTSP